jgi:hypothetical protein
MRLLASRLGLEPQPLLTGRAGGKSVELLAGALLTTARTLLTEQGRYRQGSASARLPWRGPGLSCAGLRAFQGHNASVVSTTYRAKRATRGSCFMVASRSLGTERRRGPCGSPVKCFTGACGNARPESRPRYRGAKRAVVDRERRSVRQDCRDDKRSFASASPPGTLPAPL